MYALKVQVRKRTAAEEEISEEASRLANELRLEQAAEEAASSIDVEGKSIEFTAGNPRVEHITGVVHLYRNVPTKEEAEARNHEVISMPVRFCVSLCSATHPGVLFLVKVIRLPCKSSLKWNTYSLSRLACDYTEQREGALKNPHKTVFFRAMHVPYFAA